MANLTYSERQQLEQCFGMRSGYVLDFSNRTFEEFIQETVARNIYNGNYSARGTSKANHLRAFVELEPNHVVGTLIATLIEHARTVSEPPPADLLANCERIAHRLKQSAPVLDHLTTDTSESTFAALTKSVRQAIESNEPQAGLDRLHTFFVSYLRSLCDTRGLQASRDEPAHSLLGKYLKYLKANDHIESEMTERILKYALGTMDAFNHVRNNQSLAHPNPMLDYDETLLIYNHVVAVVNFIRAIERRIDTAQPAVATAFDDGDIPF